MFCHSSHLLCRQSDRWIETKNVVTLCDCPSIFQNHHDNTDIFLPLIINNSCFLLVSEACDTSHTPPPANRLLTFHQHIGLSLREEDSTFWWPNLISHRSKSHGLRRRWQVEEGRLEESFARGPRDKLVLLPARVPPVPKKI